jgi:hypothetical protein
VTLTRDIQCVACSLAGEDKLVIEHNQGQEGVPHQ